MIRGLFFDQDGVIVDTEHDGHRVAFNRAFEEFGLNVEWDVDTYHELLQVAGGKEQISHYLRTRGLGVKLSKSEESEVTERLHRRKTVIFIELIRRGELPLRPGVKRLMKEALERSAAVGICTTSNEKAAEAVVSTMLADIPFSSLAML